MNEDTRHLVASNLVIACCQSCDLSLISLGTETMPKKSHVEVVNVVRLYRAILDEMERSATPEGR